MTSNLPLFLIVDQEKIPDSISMIFHRQRISFHQVFTAADCLKIVMNRNFALVVIDENLSDLPGLTLVSLLKRMKPDIEIVFTTSNHNPQKEIDARLAGILYYAVKPIDWSLLGEIIERTLSKRSPKLLLSSQT